LTRLRIKDNSATALFDMLRSEHASKTLALGYTVTALTQENSNLTESHIATTVCPLSTSTLTQFWHNWDRRRCCPWSKWLDQPPGCTITPDHQLYHGCGCTPRRMHGKATQRLLLALLLSH